MRLIASDANHGFAKGNNIAAREARGRYLLLLNPDTVVLDGAIDRLVAFAERDPSAGIWGGRTVFADGSLNPMSVFADQTLWSVFCRTSGLALLFRGSPLFNPEEYGAWARDSERAVDAVQGCFFLIRRDLWKTLGGFDASFVMYGEEADLCRRARARGAAPRMTPEATIVHHAGAASRLRSDKAILVLKARITLARRHLPRWQRPLAVGLIRLWPLTRSLGGSVIGALTGRRRGAEAAAHWGAVWRARADWQDGFPALPHPAPAR
jgi:GT2 family glycosyltransferase